MRYAYGRWGEAVHEDPMCSRCRTSSLRPKIGTMHIRGTGQRGHRESTAYKEELGKEWWCRIMRDSYEKPRNSSNEGNLVTRIFACHLSRSCMHERALRKIYTRLWMRRAHLDWPPAVPGVPRKRRQLHDEYHLRACDVVGTIKRVTV